MATHSHDPLQPHAHDPNFEPPPGGPAFLLRCPDGTDVKVELEALEALPLTVVENCYIVSTGHGTSGPFAFGGATLLDLVEAHTRDRHWSAVEVVSGDGFGNRVLAQELYHLDRAGPILLAYQIDGQPLTREEGLVRLVVPSEKDDALRQVKWVAQVNIT